MSFTLNKYITLKLEGNKTFIYVDNKKLIHCKHIILQIPKKDISLYNNIESIDDIFQVIDKKNYEKLDPETEFWGHCSNLQAWVENNYSTNVLQSQLAFTLLKKLYELGDKTAKRVFKEEIVKRLKMTNYQVKKYLILEGFLKFLTNEELIIGLLNPNDANILLEVQELSRYEYKLIADFDDIRDIQRNNNLFFTSKKDKIRGIEINLENQGSKGNLLERIGKLSHLNELIIYTSQSSLSIKKFKGSIKNLYIFSRNKIKIKDNFNCLPNLQQLTIRGKEKILIENNFSSLNKLKNIEVLELDNVTLKTLPEYIHTLPNLRTITISNSKLTQLPNRFWESNSIKNLYLINNPDLKIDEKNKKGKKIEIFIS
jgi:hypothetical protein